MFYAKVKSQCHCITLSLWWEIMFSVIV